MHTFKSVRSYVLFHAVEACLHQRSCDVDVLGFSVPLRASAIGFNRTEAFGRGHYDDIALLSFLMSLTKSGKRRPQASKHGCKQSWIQKTSALQMFYEEGNAFSTFVTARCTQCISTSSAECKHDFCLFRIKLHGAPLVYCRLVVMHFPLFTFTLVDCGLLWWGNWAVSVPVFTRCWLWCTILLFANWKSRKRKKFSHFAAVLIF